MGVFRKIFSHKLPLLWQDLCQNKVDCETINIIGAWTWRLLLPGDRGLVNPNSAGGYESLPCTNIGHNRLITQELYCLHQARYDRRSGLPSYHIWPGEDRLGGSGKFATPRPALVGLRSTSSIGEAYVLHCISVPDNNILSSGGMAWSRPRLWGTRRTRRSSVWRTTIRRGRPRQSQGCSHSATVQVGLHRPH